MRSKMMIHLSLLCVYINVLLLVLVCGSRKQDYAVIDQIQKINMNTDSTFEDVSIVESDIRLPPVESAANSGELSNALRIRSRLWPGGVVPYVLNNSIVNRTKHIEVLRVAMEIWENNTCVKFVQRTYQHRYVNIFYGSRGCNSNIGMLRTRPSELSLGSRCDIVPIATHELGHLLGLGHEQNRPDRDQYINILWENIDPAFHKVFKKQNHWTFHDLGTPYDYNSIMHYGRQHFSKNEEPTMVPRDPKIKRFGNIYPSRFDFIQINRMYSCPDTPIFPDHFSIQSTSPPFLNCIAIRQLRDTEWGTKYLCYKSALKKFNITWSPDGPVEGQECINTVMPYERSAKFWANSFLCMPRDSVLKLSWSISRPLNELKCMVMRKGRQMYFLCGKFKHRKMDGGWSQWSTWRSCTQQCGGGLKMRERSCDSPVPKYGGAPCTGDYYETTACNLDICPEVPSWPHDFKFMHIGFTPRRMRCISIYERYQYSFWARAKLCWPSTKKYINLRWSDHQPRKGMRCTQITERSGRYQSVGWNDNYLCVKNVSYDFKWSTNGPIKGLKCLRWHNSVLHARLRNLWKDNYLCASEYPKPARSSSTGCYPRWHSFFVNRVPYCYFPVGNKYHNWEEAQTYCEENKSNLTSITSKEEQNFIKTISSGSGWIGLHMERDWKWKDGSGFTYKNWGRGEPNNGGTSNIPEKCAIFNKINNNWNDYPCDTKFSNFICKMKGVLQ